MKGPEREVTRREKQYPELKVVDATMASKYQTDISFKARFTEPVNHGGNSLVLTEGDTAFQCHPATRFYL